MVLQYIWPGCIRIPACCFTAKENDDYEKKSTKEIKLQAKKSLQGHVGTVILGLLAVYGLNTLGTILSTNLFSGTSALDLVLSEIFMLVVSLIVGIISAGLGYMLLNISRGKGVFSGRSWLLFQKTSQTG